jgi:lipocalin
MGSSLGVQKQNAVDDLLDKLDNRNASVDLEKYSGKWFEIATVTDFSVLSPEEFDLENVTTHFRVTASSLEVTEVQMTNCGDYTANEYRKFQEQVICHSVVTSD